MRGLVVALLLAFQAPRLWADAFEPLGYGAAAKGSGGAFTALAEDGSAAYWNPANLSLVRKPQVTSSFEDLYGLGLLRYTTLGYSHPNVGGGTAGFHLLRLQTVGEASFFTYAENTYMFSYGRHLWGPFSAGAGMRFYSVASQQRATGLGFDAGLLYVPSSSDRVRFALSGQNINEPRLRWGTGAEDVLPPSWRAGTLFRLGPVSEFTFDYGFRRHEKGEYRLGMAHHLVRRLFVLRAGAHKAQDQDEWNPSVGGGFHFRRLDLDYAWDHHEELGNSQTFAMTFRFGK
jgi:hypothetical protein